MTHPRYEFTEDDQVNGKAGILITEDPDGGHKLTLSGEMYAHRRAEAEAMRQEYAVGIADWMTKQAVLDFAARVAAWLRTPEAVDEFCDSGAAYTDEFDWCAAQILAAARGERTMP